MLMLCKCVHKYTHRIHKHWILARGFLLSELKILCKSYIKLDLQNILVPLSVILNAKIKIKNKTKNAEVFNT